MKNIPSNYFCLNRSNWVLIGFMLISSQYEEKAAKKCTKKVIIKTVFFCNLFYLHFPFKKVGSFISMYRSFIVRSALLCTVHNTYLSNIRIILNKKRQCTCVCFVCNESGRYPAPFDKLTLGEKHLIHPTYHRQDLTHLTRQRPYI